MASDDLRTWPTDRLVQFALLEHLEFPEDEVDPREDAVLFLSLRSRDGQPDVIEVARRLCASADADERRLGVRVIASAATIHDEVVSLLLGMLAHEDVTSVIRAIGMAFGEREDVRAIEPLVALKGYPDEDVRFGVVIGLLTHDDPLAVQALIELSDDADSDVRDWATFGLGSMIEVDTPELREALAQRLADPDENTRAEATLGLARRRDERAVPAMLRDIHEGWDGLNVREAIEAFPHPDVLTALEQSLNDKDSDWNTWARGVLAHAGDLPPTSQTNERL